QMRKCLLLGVAMSVASAGVHAQSQPTTPVNLFVSELTYTNGAIHIGAPKKLTADKGINSQPSFTPDGKSILFVRRDSSGGQGDVFKIDLITGRESRLTSTPE